jgi:hypothetical protein
LLRQALVPPHGSGSVVAPKLRLTAEVGSCVATWLQAQVVPKLLPVEVGFCAPTWLLGHSHSVNSVDLDGIVTYACRVCLLRHHVHPCDGVLSRLVGYTYSDTACTRVVEQVKHINYGSWKLSDFNYQHGTFIVGPAVTVLTEY